jgi:hypothetical protein
MNRPRPTVAGVLRSCGHEFLDTYGTTLTRQQRRAFRDLTACRTAALGGHVLECAECGHQQIAYNSCGNRHCPTCQATAAARWLEAQEAKLLPVPYFHLVFTLPRVLGPLVLANQRVVYDLLLRSAAQTVLEVAANPNHLGAQTGLLVVLHTWGQNLHFHPHAHCVVPGGGLALDGTSWVAARPRFFLPVKILSAVFRGKFLEALREAHTQGQLQVPGADSTADPTWDFEGLVSAAVKTAWVVYSKPPFGGPKVVLKYLARYTHRVAISNRRLRRLKGGRVWFDYKDYAHRRKKRTMELSAVEFARRFLLHILPPGFVRIRHYGLLSNRHCRDKLAACRQLLESVPVAQADPVEPVERIEPSAISPPWACPVCGGPLVVIEEFLPRVAEVLVPLESDLCMALDSS